MKQLLVFLTLVLATDAFAARPAKRPCPARGAIAKPSASAVGKPKPAPARIVAHAKAPVVVTKKPALPANRGAVGKPAMATKGAPVKQAAPKPIAKPTQKVVQVLPKPIAPAAKIAVVAPKSVASPLRLKANPFLSESPGPAAPVANEVRKPATDDPDRDRITRLQEALANATRSGILGRLRVGLRVEEVSTGRVLFDHRGRALMDPASNQKVLATAAALLRLGGEYRFRTEVVGAAPDGDGRVAGDVVLRGSGDPSLRLGHYDELAQQFVRRGVETILGNVLADPRRIQSDEVAVGRSPLHTSGAAIEVRVRPGDGVGAKATVSLRPHQDAFVVSNQTETKAKGRGKIGVSLSVAGGKIHVAVSGTIRHGRGDVVVRKAPPGDTLYAAILLRQALAQAGIDVRGEAGIYRDAGPARVSQAARLDGKLLAMASPSESLPPLFEREGRKGTGMAILALHESAPLALLIRRVNKASDNEWAERVMEIAGAEAVGGAATTGKGIKIVREVMSELGIPAGEYHPANGSGLGHNNRVTPNFMVTLLRALYFDPRVGPELFQSLSVGGVDGTTRNRFHGTSSAHRVRAKTGTLSGVSCLSGIVGDGSELLAFSILVEGHRQRSVPAVRAAQVGAVNAMMRYARGGAVETSGDGAGTGVDYETGDAETTFGEDTKEAKSETVE